MNGDGILDIIGASWGAGRIAWWDALTLAPEGWLVSSVLDVSCGPDWGTLDWTMDAPAGTSVTFQIRSSTDPDSTMMGPWSDTLYAPCSLHGILPDWEQYVQYKAILETEDVDMTPSLQSLTITWNSLGLEGGSVPFIFELLPVMPNPCVGTVEIEFYVPEASIVALMIFDVSGRQVEAAPSAVYPVGYCSVEIASLPSGVYICRMRAGEFEATQRFVVIE